MQITIDSNIIIWGIKKQANPAQQHLIPIAEEFFKWVDENNFVVIIPTVVVAEILAPLEESEEQFMLEELSRRFVIAPMDSKVSRIYARLLRGKYADIKDQAKALEIRKEKMKFDHVILATGIAYNCNKIVSNDHGVHTFSPQAILVQNLEDAFTSKDGNDQLSMF